ncbi:MarR family transcriptional regulator [Natrialba sp. INN-245]|uniref:helix-turn-helix transcriptional regulator n=1 Tax=Natrialba sp. INN-245 TaxID=2690967 RepID=UPI00131179EB|nr:MarR family transcriptional regulator [Natrialba sp. INN-245]MWV39094.1 MarR family transcriptional regulator [Natrialba sp. INN-245]
MFLNALRNGRLIAAVVLVASTFALGVQLLNPPELVVAAGGDDTAVETVGYYFAYRDVAVVAVFAAVLSASATFLALDARRSDGATHSDPEAGDDGTDAVDKERRRESWEETAAGLADTERVVYETALEAGGEIPQRDIVERTDLSKATVSRTLSSLESRGLLDRERRGMGNVVVLQ